MDKSNKEFNLKSVPELNGSKVKMGTDHCQKINGTDND